MSLITDTASLAQLCRDLSREPYVTIDTEFLRDKTYWPKLCLIQLAGETVAAAIDPLAPGIDLDPLIELLDNPDVLKVFHAARQDLEIFFHMTGRVPAPIFDAQVAAMVCGFGEAVSYENLVAKLVGARVDKSSRFTDWSLRPLSEAQLTYALSDVTHLRVAYDKLSKRLVKSDRTDWVAEEMAILTDPDTYRLDPETAWMRLKPRGGSAKFLNVLRALAAWRETEAQRLNLPRNRLLRDDALLELAAQCPTGTADLGRSRSLSRGMAEGPTGEAILAAIAQGLATSPKLAPHVAEKPDLPAGRAPLVELLKVLLKAKCERHNVALKLVANVADLEMIAGSDRAEIPALLGWRREIFGNDALALKQGKLALTSSHDSIKLVRLDAGQSEEQESPAEIRTE